MGTLNTPVKHSRGPGTIEQLRLVRTRALISEKKDVALSPALYHSQQTHRTYDEGKANARNASAALLTEARFVGFNSKKSACRPVCSYKSSIAASDLPWSLE